MSDKNTKKHLIKRIPRFFWQDFPGSHASEIPLPANIAQHALRVLRLKIGDSLIVFNGDGREFHLQLIENNPKNACVRILEEQLISRESSLKITLILPILKQEKMDWILQKSTELGVFAIQPTLGQFSSVRFKNDQIQARQKHWNAVIESACEQCGRNTLPKILPFLPFPKAIENIPLHAQKIIFLPHAKTRLKDLTLPQEIFILSGAEGGFSAEEIQMALTQKFCATCLGPRILRAETAPIAALSACNTLWGDF